MEDQLAVMLAQRIDKFCTESGKTYDQLADETGLSKGTISTYRKKLPLSPHNTTLQRILTAVGKTEDDLYEGIPRPAVTAVQKLAAVREENEELKKELTFERKLQQSLSDKIDRLTDIFDIESRKNDAMLEELRDHNDELNIRLTDTHSALKAANKEAARERRCKTGWTIAAAVLAVLLAIVSMYALYAFLAFDLPDPNKGIWPPHWIR